MFRTLAASAASIALAGAAQAQDPPAAAPAPAKPSTQLPYKAPAAPLQSDQRLPALPKPTIGDLPSRSQTNAIDQQVDRLVNAPNEATVAVDSGNEDGAFLYGSFRKPEGKDKYPVVLILPAAGVDRNGNPPGQDPRPDTYRQLADALASKGIASVRIDKRGQGASAKAIVSESDLRFDLYVNDAVRWIRFIQAQPGVGCLAVMGHSEGALVAALAAKQTKVCAIIQASGSARPASAVMAEQLKTAFDAKRLDKDSYTEAARILDQLTAGKPVENPPSKLSALFRPSVQPYLISWLPLNPVDALKTNTPVLILQGSSDFQITAEDSRRLSASPKVVKVVMVTGADHDLKIRPASAGKGAVGALSPQVATAIKAFLDVIKFP
jgi:alpha-beta hydrolase superfamily lysophospholipase